MRPNPIVVFGAGDIAELAHFYFTHDSQREVRAFTVDREYLQAGQHCGLPLVAFDEVATCYPPEVHDFFVAVSYTKLNAVRAAKCTAAKAKGYRLASYVSSKATVWPGFSAGENCFILEDNTIQPFVVLGNNVTLWSGNHIGHHARIGDNCFITSHVVVSGGVTIGENCFVGVNATLRDHVTVGRNAVIAAGAIILNDVPDDAVFTQPGAQLSKVPSSRLRKL